MEKTKVSAKDIVADVKAGLDNNGIMEKYGLRRDKLESVLEKLVEMGTLTRAEVDGRKPTVPQSAEMEPSPPPEVERPPAPAQRPAPLPVAPSAGAWKCPACGTTQAQEMDECPQCGIVVAKYSAPRVKLSKGPEAEEAEMPLPPVGYGPGVPGVGEPDFAPATDESSWALDKYCPWEDAANLGYFRALVQTCKESAFNAVQFFSRIPTDGGYGQPLLYAIILGAIGGFISGFWTLLGQLVTKPEGAAMAMTIGGMVLAPVGAAIGAFISAGIFHLCLMLFGGANRSYETTFRAVCYSEVVALIQVIPPWGPMVFVMLAAYLICASILFVVALREMHETTTGKAVGAVLLPMGLCCSLLVAFIAIAVFGILAAGAGR